MTLCIRNQEIFNSIMLRVDRINTATEQITNDFPFFDLVEEKKIMKDSSELSFLYLTAFLYGVYFERSRVNTNYIIDKMSFFLGDNIQARNHIDEVQHLRTFLFHSLSSYSKHDKKIKEFCSMWFYESCMNINPEKEEEWQVCLNKLLASSESVLSKFEECILLISKDNDIEFIREEWVLKKNKDYPDYRLISIAEKVIGKYDISIDSQKFIKQNNDKIRNKLSTLVFSNISNLEKNVELWVEQLIFAEGKLPCPVSADDIILNFNTTGKKLGMIKSKAIGLFEKDRYLNKNEIIEILKKEFLN